MRLIFVRHGESVGNFENRLQGTSEFDLTDLGERQAMLTGERLAAAGVKVLYSSPLRRALVTAQAIAGQIGSEPRELAGVREYDFGQLAGRTYAEIRQHFSADGQPPAQAAFRVYPGEEGRENFFRRVTESVRTVVERHPGESVAVVSHGGPIALLCQAVLGLPYMRPMPFAIDNCSLSVIEFREDPLAGTALPNAVLLTLNDTCHLEPLRG